MDYNLGDYGGMIADVTRMRTIEAALREAVTPGSVVLDIGAGAGIFSLLACSFGAKRVYAIEPNSCISVARELAAQNGFSDRITFYQELSQNVQLPERVDCIVSDLRGLLPLHEQHIPIIVDARTRFLKDSGCMLPARDRLWIAPIHVPQRYQRGCRPGEQSLETDLCLDAMNEGLTNFVRRFLELKSTHLIAEPSCFAELDYATITDGSVEAQLEVVISRAATGHGMAVWFETEVFGDHGYSGGPDSELDVYGTVYLPWEKPVALEAGDRVIIELQAKLTGKDYLWSWQTGFHRERDGASLPDKFKQSSFGSMPLNLDQLHRRRKDFVPALNKKGVLQKEALALMAGERENSEIAGLLQKRFPEPLATPEDALAYVSDLSEEYAD